MSREEKELRFASTTTLYAACCSPTSVGTYCSCIQDDIGDDKIILNIFLFFIYRKRISITKQFKVMVFVSLEYNLKMNKERMLRRRSTASHIIRGYRTLRIKRLR